jgi:3-oxoadipate enol-lactonase
MTIHAPPAAVPPVPLPPASTVLVPGRGEVFVRDSGGAGPAVLLLHGWMFAADTNFFPVYEALQAAGYRVIALDHQGHGRGLRTAAPFRLAECAADAAAVLRTLRAEPAVVVGYSMGGPIAQLMARDHPGSVAALVLCATAQDWQDWWMKGFWRSMALLRLWFGVIPIGVWRRLLAFFRIPGGPTRDWVAAELSRGSSVDLAEAGRELSRYDARPWIAALRALPAAVVVTTRDRGVLPRKQRKLAKALGARTFEVKGDHFAVAVRPDAFRRALLEALAAVRRSAPLARAA